MKDLVCYNWLDHNVCSLKGNMMSIQDLFDTDPDSNIYIQLLPLRNTYKEKLGTDKAKVFDTLVTLLHIEGENSTKLSEKLAEAKIDPDIIKAFEGYKRQWLQYKS